MIKKVYIAVSPGRNLGGSMSYKTFIAAAALLMGCPANERQDMPEWYKKDRTMQQLSEEVKRSEMRRKEQIYIPGR